MLILVRLFMIYFVFGEVKLVDPEVEPGQARSDHKVAHGY